MTAAQIISKINQVQDALRAEGAHRLLCLWFACG